MSSANGIVFLIGSLLLIISSLSIGVRSQEFVRPNFQPKNVAFSIWGIIFTLSIVSGIRLFFVDSSLPSSILFALACVSSSLWLIVQNQKFAFLLLYAGAILSFLASCMQKDFIASLAPSVLTGWLCIASAIGTAMYFYAANDGKEANKYAVTLPFAFLLVLASITVSIVGNKYACLSVAFPLLWTAVFSTSFENATIFLAPFVACVAFFLGKLIKCNITR